MILSAKSDSMLFRMTQMMKCQSCLMLGRQKSVFLFEICDSPMSMDSTTQCFTLTVLEGSKYWMVATKFGEHALLTLLGLNGTLTLLMMGTISAVLALRQSTSKRVTHCECSFKRLG